MVKKALDQNTLSSSKPDVQPIVPDSNVSNPNTNPNSVREQKIQYLAQIIPEESHVEDINTLPTERALNFVEVVPPIPTTQIPKISEET